MKIKGASQLKAARAGPAGTSLREEARPLRAAPILKGSQLFAGAEADSEHFSPEGDDSKRGQGRQQ